MVKDKKYTFLY